MSAHVFDQNDYQLFAGAKGWGTLGPVVRHYDNLCIVCTSETTRLITGGATEYVLPGVVWPTQYAALAWLNGALPARTSPLNYWLSGYGFKRV